MFGYTPTSAKKKVQTITNVNATAQYNERIVFKEIFKRVQNALSCFQAKSKLAEILPNSKPTTSKLAQTSLHSTKSTFAAGVAGAARVGFSARRAEASGTSLSSVLSSTFGSAVPLFVGSEASGTLKSLKIRKIFFF